MKYCFQRAWAGLYDDVDSWRWSLSNASFYKPGETEFRRWQLGEPHNRLKEYCTLLTPDGEWRDIMCDEILPPICYDVTGENIKATTGNFHVVLVLVPPVD